MYRITTLVIPLCVALLTSPSIATAAKVYKWLDTKGVIHYTQRPPRSGAVQIEVLEARGGKPGSGEATMESLKQKDSALQERQVAQQENSAKERQQAAEQAALEQECAEAKQQLATMERTPRLSYTDEAGNAARMSEDFRQTQIDRYTKFVSEKCQ